MKLSKILGICLIAGASLTGCMKSYNIDGKQLRYNKNISASMIVNEGDSLVKYYTPFKLSRPTGKDVIMTATYYKNGDLRISDTTSVGFGDKIARYDSFLEKIDSLENKK